MCNKQQRLNCLISLVYVRNLLLYPVENRPQRFDQIGAEFVFGDKWNKYTLLRASLTISLPLIMFFLDIFLLIKYSTFSLFHKKANINTNTLFVSCHRRLYNVATYAGLLKDDTVWFHTPMDLFVLPKPFKILTVYDFISVFDVWKCMYQSIRCRWFFLTNKGYDCFMMTEKCFDWLITDTALRKISPEVEIYFSNQLDRLAVLIDRLPNKRKSLIEHGIEYQYSASDLQIKNNMVVYHPDVNFYVLNRTYHFHSLTTVYCYSETDIKAFERSIIRCDPKYIIIGYGFKTTFKTEKNSVLIIGEYYTQYDNERKVISALQGMDIELFLKAHPRNNDQLYDNLRKEFDFHFISGSIKEFPDVDVVISYDSTLAHEYESIGAKVLYYGNIEIEKLRNDIAKILAR